MGLCRETLPAVALPAIWRNKKAACTCRIQGKSFRSIFFTASSSSWTGLKYLPMQIEEVRFPETEDLLKTQLEKEYKQLRSVLKVSDQNILTFRNEDFSFFISEGLFISVSYRLKKKRVKIETEHFD